MLYNIIIELKYLRRKEVEMIIDNINFRELESEKYWAFPKSFKGDPKAETKNMIFSNDYIGSRKMDGSYYRFIKDINGVMVLQGRSRSVSGNFLNKIGHVPHLHEFFESLPNGTCLLGEIYFPDDEGSHKVTSIMGCLEPKAIDRQKNGKGIHYYVFDVWAFNGESFLKTPIEKRITAITIMERAYKDLVLCKGLSEYVEFAHFYEGKELWELLGDVFDEGGEGIVMTKKGTSPEPGKRPARKTLKVKKEINETIDCLFTGKVSPPTRRYDGKHLEEWVYWEDVRTGEKKEGKHFKEYFDGAPIEPVTKSHFNSWAGSLEIGLVKENKIIPIGYLSGLTEEIRANPLKYKRKPIEVTCMEIMPETHGLRHAKLVRFRDDLTIEDCSWEKVFG